MISSMTGFASIERETVLGTLVIGLRSVNHRYVELQFHLDDSLRAFEPQLRESISKRIRRGKLECHINLIAKPENPATVKLSEPMLAQLAQLSSIAQQHFPQSSPPSVSDILRWPGMLITDSVALKTLEPELLTAFDQCLSELCDSRKREGEKLAHIVLNRVDQLETLAGKVQSMLPSLIESYQEKITAKLRQMLQDIDDSHITQVLASYIQKVDIDEELSRLTSHLQEVQNIINKGGTVGKRLDFLMQELNREANTLGAKSVSTELSQASMEFKVLIEQIREQVQNIE